MFRLPHTFRGSLLRSAASGFLSADCAAFPLALLRFRCIEVVPSSSVQIWTDSPRGHLEDIVWFCAWRFSHLR